MNLMYSMQCQWGQFIQESRSLILSDRCNPLPQLSTDTNSRSHWGHMLWIRVVFYNINEKFWCRFWGSPQLLLQVQEFKALSAVRGLQVQSFISKDARILPWLFCCSSGKIPGFMSWFIVVTFLALWWWWWWCTSLGPDKTIKNISGNWNEANLWAN